MKIYSIGGNGLVGSRVEELLKYKYSFTTVSSSIGVDITMPHTLMSLTNNDDHEIVILFAAKTDVDGCELDKPQGADGDTWKINVTGVQNVVNACLPKKKKLIYISTDFVFDGENCPESGYTEEDTPNPLNWYAQTKFEGEKIVQESGLPFIILRPAFPYRAKFDQKKDFVRAILGALQDGKKIKGITDQIFCPTFIDDIAYALDILVTQNATGIYHTVGSLALTPFDAAKMIARTFDSDERLIAQTTRYEYFAGKAKRPYNLTLNNAKIERLGVKMRTFEEGLTEVENQMLEVKSTS